jgi:hypothetical protein
MKEYSQVKFKSVLEKRELEYYPLMDELLKWCYVFQREGLVPDPISGKKGGNFSFRIDDGFIATPSGKPLDQLTNKDLVKVRTVDEKLFEVYSVGLIDATSEAFLHWYVYSKRSEINAVFHSECPLITKNPSRLGIPETENWQDWGTVSLAYEVLKVLETYPGCKSLVMKDHGEIYLGETIEEAGNIALKTLDRAKKL